MPSEKRVVSTADIQILCILITESTTLWPQNKILMKRLKGEPKRKTIETIHLGRTFKMC